MFGVGQRKSNMVISKCWICNQEFEAIRKSRLCCSFECRKLYQVQYDRDRYLEFRNGNRKRKREMLVEKYSISSSNLYNLEYCCDECLTKFYYDYSIYESFSGNFISSYNTTSWGVPCCPQCGLVEKSTLDELPIQYNAMNEVERKLFLAELHKFKQPLVKREAIYLKNVVDFIAEAEIIRNMRNRINDIGKLTQNQIDECISILFRKIRKLK